jgi:hypothetical protein
MGNELLRTVGIDPGQPIQQDGFFFFAAVVVYV